jgi:tetratricopeptide (TPR) repeat protein
VARGTQHRKRRTQPNARVAAQPARKQAKPQHARWEDQLFFSRMRNHAKWVFGLLIVVFAVGFVLFGVGSGSTGVSGVLQNFFSSSGSSGSSASSLQKKASANPGNATDWRNLATKLESDSRIDDAITALKHYTSLKPKDQDSLQELASLYLRRATEEQQVYTDAQTRTGILSPTDPYPPASTTDLGKAISSLTSPIQSAVSSVVGTTGTGAYSAILQFESEAVTAYQKLAKLAPKDAQTQLQLAQVAQASGSTSVAIAAYTKFLKLAPDDPSASSAKTALKQLKAQVKATATPSTSKK